MKVGMMLKPKGLIQRAKAEYSYYAMRHWNLEDVGRFWDTVKNYDDINEKIYPYFRRFTNSFDLAEKYLPRHDYTLLDIQTRSGKGSLFWHEKKKIKSATCVDFSDFLVSVAKKRLRESNLKHEIIKISNFPLPFEDRSFNLICAYETVEHISDYSFFIKELSRTMTDDGIMIITCPNKAWNWVHSLTAIIGINHSEGPHRFLRRGELLNCFKTNHLALLEENSTIIFPFNHPFSIKIDSILEKYLPTFIKQCVALRRTFILKKGMNRC